MEIAVLLLGMVVLVGAFWLTWTLERKRREKLHAFALSQGWAYAARDDRWTRFDGTPFGDGDNRKAKNVLTGTYRGRDMVAFDYSYETHSTDSDGRRTTQVHKYAVCSLQLPTWLPRLELGPESVFGRVATAFGMQDIEFESEDFNRRYRVRCGNPKFAYDVLQPRTLEILAARPARHLRLSGTDALSWNSGTHDPADLLARLDTLDVVIKGIPTFVWNDLKGQA